MANGLLSGLQRGAGILIGGGSGFTEAKREEEERLADIKTKKLKEARDEQTIKIAGLKEGIDTSRLGDKDYTTEFLDRQQQEGLFDDPKGTVGGLLRIRNSPEFANLDTKRQVEIDDALQFEIRNPERRRFIKQQEALGTGQGQIQIQPQIDFEKGQAKDISTATSELADLEANLPELTQTLERLIELSPTATFTKAGQVKGFLAKEFGRETPQGIIDRTEFQSTIDNQILPLLRQTFGAAFTAEEGNSLRATLGDVNKTPEEKTASIRAFMAQATRNIQSKKRRIGQEDNIGRFEIIGEE